MEQLNPIACELCRAKKCKCDRRLPLCSQCSSIGALCQYPQSNKRGIPAGYISSLEQRLLETEVALFEALSVINNPQYRNDETHTESSLAGVLSDQSTRQSKEAKIEEWKRLPLRTSAQRQTWWRDRVAISKGRGRDKDSSNSSGMEPSTSPATTENHWSGPSPGSGQQGSATTPDQQHLHHQQHHEDADYRQMSPNMYGVVMSGGSESMHRPGTQESPSRHAMAGGGEGWEQASMPWHPGEGHPGGRIGAAVVDGDTDMEGGFSSHRENSGSGRSGSGDSGAGRYTGAGQDKKSMQLRKYF
ncbi:hypothetical protein F5884DRAFT_468578 [Xylogone sp. PMI_703]|nr:hypothetical protein F5884DRAFT_468578 [Xylogone sp. PMI_703]